MDIWVVVVLVGAALVVLGVLVAIAGIIVDRRGEEAAPAVETIWDKIVKWVLDKLSFLMDKVLQGNVTALGLILVILGALCIGGGIWGASRDDDNRDPPTTTTTSTAADDLTTTTN